MAQKETVRKMGGPGGGRQMLQKGAIKTLNMGTVKRLLSYLKAYKVKLVLVFICILLATLASVASSLFLQTLIDDYVMPLVGAVAPDFSGLFHALMIMCVVYVVGIISVLFYNRTMAVISQGTLKIIRDEMFSHMQTLPIRYFDRNTHGDIMSHFTNDADTLRQMLSQTLPQLFSSVISLAAVFCSMLHLSIWLTLLVVAFTFFSLFLVKSVASRSGGYFVKQQKSLGELNGFVEEMINGEKVIKVFCHEGKAKEEFIEKNEELRKNMSRANALSMIIMPMMGNLGNVLYVLVALVGGALGLAGVVNLSIGGEATVTMGTIASFLVLSRNFMNPITQVSQQLNSVIMAMAGAGRIFELLDEKPETDEGHVTLVNVREEEGRLVECEEKTGIWAWKDGDKLTRLKGAVVLDDVDFSYIEGKQVLYDVDVFAEPGQKVAFVGATGAGKTTITNLINRFYDIEDGKITYDGININTIKKNDLRRSLGIVLQDVNLFTGTVMENIRYGNLDATDEECIEAAKLVNADSFIRMLPKGYNTVLEGDGSGLSQGQRQLISIARAAVADPPCMILDEATSSIDTRTESIVQKGMDNLMANRTVFVIAHRLSTVQNSDVIMVMEKGRIIERGSHDRLMEKKGRYYKLYTGATE
ncbi:MAG: ABC transporter ATP-binding protein [Firmicutes bacterium]|nr:ABC transporter ATP-binding protein [Bacillota bacterium]